MSFQDWEAEVQRRIGIDEGYSKTVYMDSASPPDPTIGVGFNLNRADARVTLSKIGADYDAVRGGAALTDQQVSALFAYSFAPVVDEARASLQPFHFDSMSDARRFVICDLTFNLGNQGWLDFANTRSVIDQACHALRSGNAAGAHVLFGQAADALAQSAWYSQVGNRAKRDCAMMRTSNWCDPNGDGSDAG
jgi:GH24 family phage-related lysozyme (muramidase)